MRYSIFCEHATLTTTITKRIFLFLWITLVSVLNADAALAQVGDARLLRQEVKEQVVSKRQFGWERPLTQKEPNLSHWHWEPISNSYRQVQTRNLYARNVHSAAVKIVLPDSRKEKANAISTSAKMRSSKNYAYDTLANLMKPIGNQMNAPVVSSYDSTYHSQPSSYRVGLPNHSRTTVAGKLLRNHDADFE